jgi:DNA-binding NtrC family response regulator
VRIVAATHQTDGLGSEGARLRPDLYHRLATVVLALTPLRERMSDLGELVEGMLDDLAPEHGRKTVTADGWHALASYGWPGNIRELSKAAQRAVTLGGDELGPLDFFPSFGQHAHRRHVQATPAMPFAANANGTSELDALQPYHAALRGAMEQALAAHGTIRAAASAIGMPKSTFADKARAWGLFPRRKVRIHQPENRRKK